MQSYPVLYHSAVQLDDVDGLTLRWLKLPAILLNGWYGWTVQRFNGTVHPDLLDEGKDEILVTEAAATATTVATLANVANEKTYGYSVATLV